MMPKNVGVEKKSSATGNDRKDNLAGYQDLKKILT
jgi:hypothetical protein